MSFNVAALNARLNSTGSPERVSATKELVTHVPMFEPIMIGIAFFADGMMPAPTIVTTIEDVAVAL
ncbi:hypothetical protein BpHYR1_045402 [Brachionus plicatilis]|uniref:Uncharacterized protein n=1 Tax=Brachionus plicatilis TaxID=10195 RepID=A0A3M7SM53_BRAPC|nr:hypothetical protein BpHYR1_045402 [Brachionus plicatilis]